MNRIRTLASTLGIVLLALTGCSSKEKSTPEPAAPSKAAAPDQASAPAPSEAPPGNSTEAISSARNSLKAGNVDEAAARLAQLQMQGASFNAQQAKDYRQILSEAYDRAIEAAQRGDPKGQAALQLLRAAAPR